MKILYFDVETTGLDPRRAAIWQLAFLLEVNGKIVEKQSYKMRPHEGAEIDPEALEVGKVTEEQLNKFHPPKMIFEMFTGVLSHYVDKLNRNDKFFLGGYNVSFDTDFLANWFKRYGDKYGFGSCTNWRKIDPLPILHWLDFTGKYSLQSYKLAKVCEAFDIKLDAHEAMSDIMATKELIDRIRKKFNTYQKVG